MHDRGEERAQIRRRLDQGKNLHVPAPRRIGKTWTLEKLAEDLQAQSWITIELDVQGMRTEIEFARALCGKIQSSTDFQSLIKSHLFQRLENLFSGQWTKNPLEALSHCDPEQFCTVLIDALNSSASKSAILIDEISFFVLALANTDRDRAQAFVYHLRSLQQRFKNVRWVLTGSIGLDLIARTHGFEGAFVDLDTFVLEPFTREQAMSFLQDPQLQQGFHQPFSIGAENLDYLIQELGWPAPYYIELVANQIRPSGDGGVATRADIDRAFERLLAPERRKDFAVWREHIDKNLPKPEGDIARALLDRLCTSPDGETFDTVIASLRQGGFPQITMRQIKDVSNALQVDGLVQKQEGERIAFRSGLVRRYWQEYEAE